MKTIAEMQSILSGMGVKKRFKPYYEGERDTIFLRVRRPAQIVDGRLIGSEIDLYDSNTFRVWTNRKNKANAVAKQHNLRVRLLNEEVELYVLYVPANLADELLPQFGAKVKHTKSPKQLAASKLGLEQARNGLNLQKNPLPNEVLAAKTEKPYQGSGVGAQTAGVPVLPYQSPEINKTAKI